MKQEHGNIIRLRCSLDDDEVSCNCRRQKPFVLEEDEINDPFAVRASPTSTLLYLMLEWIVPGTTTRCLTVATLLVSSLASECALLMTVPIFYLMLRGLVPSRFTVTLQKMATIYQRGLHINVPPKDDCVRVFFKTVPVS